MKLHKYIIVAGLAIALLLPAMTAAKKNQGPQRVYMFGFAASFNDTIVHFTEIQPVDSAMLDTKHGFLLLREQYSIMLSNYLTEQKLPYRTCVVFYNRDADKLQKKFLKMKKLYVGNGKQKNSNDIRTIATSDFRFKAFKVEPDEPVEPVEEDNDDPSGE